MLRRWLLLGVLVSFVFVGCGTPSEDGEEAGGDALTSTSSGGTVNVNHLLEDDDILGGSDIDATDIQAFLEKTGSALATYKDGGQTAAQVIADRCHKAGISPVYMLARIQGESSLIESKTSTNIEKATGCGCPDGKGCSKSDAGFGNQITCAANLIQKYFDEMASSGATISGWSVGKTMKTLDPCTVKPENKGTAALYTYTPWVGANGDGCGTKEWGGSSLIALLVQKYRGDLHRSGATAAPGASTDAPPSDVTPATPRTDDSDNGDPCDGLPDGWYCDGVDVTASFLCSGGAITDNWACGGGTVCRTSSNGHATLSGKNPGCFGD
jgi:hypothetical protein